MYQITPQLPINGLVFLLAVSLAAYGGVQYHCRGHQSDLLAFTSLMLAIGLWNLTTIFIHVVTSAELMLLGFDFLNTVVVWLFVYSFLWFALAYSDNTRWVNRWTVGIAVTTILVTSTAGILRPGFMYDVNGLVTRGPVTILGVTFQEWVVLDRDLKSPFLLSQLYGYAVMLIGGGVLGQYLHRNRGDLYTGQATALAVGIGTPLVVNFLLFAGIIPPGVGATSIAFAVTGIAFAIAIFRYRLLRVAPLGRQQLVDRMADAVVMLDDERRVVDCNLAARGLVDAPARWRGMAATEFFAPFPEQVEEVAGQASVPTEISIEDDGQTRHFELNRSPIEDGENIATGQLIVLRNVTEQRERERQLQRQNERLDQFASTVAHDLRNPLHVAQGYLELVQGESESEHLASIKNAHERMEALTNDLLTLARAGQTVENPALIGLANVAGAAWTHTDLANCEFTPGVPAGTKLEADRDRLLQVFENLYRNAADHNDTPVTVRVGMLGDREPSTDGGQRRGFFVEDTGDGILDEQREEIFEHGYTTSADGSGFGLSIVWDIVKAHGWDIRVTAGSDGGARFEITGVGFTENSAEITHLISER